MSDIRLTLPRPHAGQRILLDGANRFNVVSCGRRFGKTTLGGNILSKYILTGTHAAWAAPTYRLLEEAYNDHLRIYRPVISNATKAPSPRIELITGTHIDYWTLTDPSIIGRGRKYGVFVLDEAAMARHLETAWTEAIRPTLTDYKGDAWFLSTPKGHNYFKTLFDKGSDETEPEWSSFQMPTTMNPFIDPEEVAAAGRGIPSLAFKQEYLAEFVDSFGARIKREWMRYGECPAGLPVVLGVDLAISTKTEADYTAVVALSRDELGTIYVRDVVRERLEFAGVIRLIGKMAEKWKPTAIHIEQVQYQAAVIQELMRNTTLPVRGIKPDKDKVTRFSPLEARYEHGQIYHCPGLPGFWEDELMSFPVGLHDDCVDAMAYAFGGLQTRRGFFAAD